MRGRVKSAAAVVAICAAMLVFASFVRADGYALLINGGGGTGNNSASFQNDIRQIYDVLMNVLGYPKENITIISADGQNHANDRTMHRPSGTEYLADSWWDLDGDSLTDIEAGAATRANVLGAIDSLAATLQPNDQVFIYFSDHGSTYNSSGGSYVCTWTWPWITDTELAARLNQFHVALEVVAFGTCFSGGFIPDLDRPGRIVITQADYDEYGYGWYYMPTREYDWGSYNTEGEDRSDFVNHLFWSVTGPGDENFDGRVSVLEAFNYAVENDDFGPNGYDYEHSQISDIANIAGTVTLEYNDGWIFGDAELDWDVDFRDYQILEQNFDTGIAWVQGDFEGDGDVDFADYQMLEVNFGTVGGSQSTPEPTTVALMALGTLGTLLLRHKRK